MINYLSGETWSRSIAWTRFEVKRREFEYAKWDAEPVMLFHGTSFDNTDGICRQSGAVNSGGTLVLDPAHFSFFHFLTKE